MELSKELITWIAEEEAKWAAEIAIMDDSQLSGLDLIPEIPPNGGIATPTIIASQASGTTPTIPPEIPPRCWDHGCNGREFSSNGNLFRHQREWASRSFPLESLQPEPSPPPKPRCWDHGCRGRQFASTSNLYRHQRENRWKEEAICTQCNVVFIPVYVLPARRNRPETPQCWDHGCNGKVFARYSSLYRHQREMFGRPTLCCSCFVQV